MGRPTICSRVSSFMKIRQLDESSYWWQANGQSDIVILQIKLSRVLSDKLTVAQLAFEASVSCSLSPIIRWIQSTSLYVMSSKIHFNIILASAPACPKSFPAFISSYYNYASSRISHLACYISLQSHSSSFYQEYRLWNSSVRSFHNNHPITFSIRAHLIQSTKFRWRILHHEVRWDVNEYGSVNKDVVVAYFKTFSRHVPGKTAGESFVSRASNRSPSDAKISDLHTGNKISPPPGC